MFWGYSPALDLLTEYKLQNMLEGKTELNILVAGSADVRHVLMTIAKCYKHDDAENITINFYVVDLLLEFVARELLLTLIALEPSDRIGLKEKADLWMEIFGNSMLRPTTAEFVTKKSYQYIKMVTNKKYQIKRMPCLNLDNLKYKEKDRLETIFKFWIKNQFNMAQNWDQRVRKHLGTRYDSKIGAFDWDYYMHIKELKDGEKVNSREYTQWRKTGVAFTWLEKEFSVSNVTLAVGIDCDGDRLVSFNYLGDIVSGPFYCFGLECEDKGMMKLINEQHAKRSTDITERNLMRLFYEIENQSAYKHIGEDRDLGVTVTEMARLNFDDPKIKVEFETCEDDYTALPIKHKIIFLPTKTLEDPAKLQKYHRFFDLASLGQGLFTKLDSILGMVIDKGIIIMENRKFMLFKKEELKKFFDETTKIMREAQCEQLGKINYEDDNFMKFQVKISHENIAGEDKSANIANEAILETEKKETDKEERIQTCEGDKETTIVENEADMEIMNEEEIDRKDCSL